MSTATQEGAITMTTCHACNGVGYYFIRYWTLHYGLHEDRRECGFCNGTGQVDTHEQETVIETMRASWNRPEDVMMP